jgi:hypothetical protein
MSQQHNAPSPLNTARAKQQRTIILTQTAQLLLEARAALLRPFHSHDGNK